MSISVFKNPNSQYSPSLSNFFYTLPRWNGFKFTGRVSKSLSWVKRKSIVCYSTDGVSSLDKNNSSLSENLDLTKEIENESDVLIECKDVHKAFGVKQILKGVSFKIRHGEAVGIIGTSGTGKSTVLKIIAGLLTPDKGEVFVHGKKRVGLVSDEEFLGVRVGLIIWILPSLQGVEECLPSELSGGMKKRVALARSIIYDNTTNAVQPKVLLYDEPTAGLDPIASTVVEDLIRSVHLKPDDTNKKQGKIASYVVVTHQHSTIRRAVDRLLFLHEGRIIWEGMTHEFTSSTNPIVRQFASGSLDGPIIY